MDIYIQALPPREKARVVILRPDGAAPRTDSHLYAAMDDARACCAAHGEKPGAVQLEIGGAAALPPDAA